MAKNKLNKVNEKENKPEQKLIEVKSQFKNNSEKGIKIKLVNGKKFKWITVKPGESVIVPKKIAKANGLVRIQ